MLTVLLEMLGIVALFVFFVFVVGFVLLIGGMRALRDYDEGAN